MKKNVRPQAPIAYRGDRVHAQPHKGIPRDGTVRAVEIQFGWGDERTLSYPIYAINFDGQSRDQWLGEEAIYTVYATQDQS